MNGADRCSYHYSVCLNRCIVAYSTEVEDEHLRGRADLRAVWIAGAKLTLLEGVAVACGDAICPGAALGARPFEAMVAMTQANRLGWLIWLRPADVVVTVGRGDDHPTRAR